MKMNMIRLCAITALVFFSAGLSAVNKPYKGNPAMTFQKVERKGDSIYVSITFDMSNIKVKKLQAISFVPYIVSTKTSLELPSVVVRGHSNYLIDKREQELMSKSEKIEYMEKAPYTAIKGFKSKESKIVDYTQVLRYEPWMEGAIIEIREDHCGCGTAPALLSNVVIDTINTIVPEYIFTPSYAILKPVADVSKKREIKGDVFLDFVISKTDIRPDYMNNPRELKKVTDLITELKADGNILIKSVSIIGFASPEGTYQFNQYLSENRARALVNYLAPRFDYDKNMYKVVYGGENWVGLKEMVQASQDIPAKEECIVLLNKYSDSPTRAESDKLKVLLRRIDGGIPYIYIFNKLCPHLRKSECSIEFEFKEFSLAKAREIIKTNPKLLKHEEMYQVANSYEVGSQEFISAWETAANLYPTIDVANINAATASLIEGQSPKAYNYLARVKNTQNAEYLNCLGLLKVCEKEYDAAGELFRKSYSMGLKQAGENLEDLQKLISNKNDRDIN